MSPKSTKRQLKEPLVQARVPSKPTKRQLKEQVQARALSLVKVLDKPAHEIEEVFWLLTVNTS
jgi:hypothetical protein